MPNQAYVHETAVRAHRITEGAHQITVRARGITDFCDLQAMFKAAL